MTNRIEEIKKEIVTKKETAYYYGNHGQVVTAKYYLDLVKELENELAELLATQVKEDD